MSLKTKEVYLPDIVGKGYGSFWNFKGRYRVVKGSRASKKSKTIAINSIWRIMAYPNSNMLVVRKVKDTLRDSCFSDLMWATERLSVADKWHFKTSPLEATYKPTGQKILFRGLDDPLKIASVSVSKGSLNFLWIEEAYEISSEDDFNTLDESIRGEVDPGLFKQVTISFNPWNEKHWLKKRFFDVDDPDIMAITTNYKCNEWLDKSDKRVFERMKEQNPRRYEVAGLGNWGIVDGLVYENWREQEFSVSDIINKYELESCFGLDYGYTNDPSALFCGLIDKDNKKLWVFDEMYKKGMSNESIADKIKSMGYSKEIITADSAEPKSNDRLRTLGINRLRSAKKGKDSINAGIDFLQDFEIIIHPKCVNFITEIGNYQWDKDKFGNAVNKPIDDFNHLMDAMRYGTERFQRGNTFSFD